MITSRELRQKFLDFMASKDHAILPSGSLVPKEDPTVLFINSGMQPLVPYLMGQPHSEGVRLANSQRCLRTEDIQEVGDNRHCTFFEMLGFWSLGDYFKQEAISWTFEFLTSKEWLGLDPHRIFVTVYKGNGSDVQPDTEAIGLWKEQFARFGIDAEDGIEYDFANPDTPTNGKYIYRITQRSGKDNWWGLPYRGPCGPCSEMYYLLDTEPLDFETRIFPSMTVEEIEDFVENNIVEIGNNVFMQYEGEKTADKEPINLTPLKRPNIDTGIGFERLLMVCNGVDTTQKTDVLLPLSQIALDFATQSNS